MSLDYFEENLELEDLLDCSWESGNDSEKRDDFGGGCDADEDLQHLNYLDDWLKETEFPLLLNWPSKITWLLLLLRRRRDAQLRYLEGGVEHRGLEEEDIH